MNIRVLSILAALFLFPLVSNAQQCQSESCGNQSQNVPLPTPTCGVNCGNGVCNTNENENFGTCPQDCHCGDGVCSSAYNENHSNCARDCGSDSVVCGDGVCSFSSGENSANCPRDCGGATPTPTVTPPPNPTPTPTATPTTTPTTSSVNCGDGVCSSSLGENTRTCPRDCGTEAFCGDGVCSTSLGENQFNCSANHVYNSRNGDCMVSCGNGICEPDMSENVNTCQPDCGVTTTTVVPTTTTTIRPTTTTVVPTTTSTVRITTTSTTTTTITGPICSFTVMGRSGRDFVHNPHYYANAPTCLTKLIEEGLAHCRTLWTGGVAKYADNCVASLLVENRYRTVADGRYRIDAGQDVTLYFDAACNRVNRPLSGYASCNAGFYLFGASPVSLLWDSSSTLEDLRNDVRLVSFPIDPTQPNKLVEWKASAKAPLLVYDPEGKGKITSGYQLFGNWTFGPKKLASLAEPASFDGGKLWNNGFDALSKLDVNSDGEVSGKELDDLSLWFDENRNAVSEKGEVRRVASVGVKKLFYKGYTNSEAANAIVLNTGFERVLAGKTEQGIMADWFTETVSSELEYAQKAMVASAFSRNTSTDSKPINGKTKHTGINPKIIGEESQLQAFKKGAALVRGAWSWNSDSKDVPLKGGTLVLTDNEDGTISGLATVELQMESSFGANSAGLLSGFTGMAKLEEDGSVSVDFELKNESGETVLKSTAKLNKEGTSLSGSSSGTVDSPAAKTNVSYTWVGKKLN